MSGSRAFGKRVIFASIICVLCLLAVSFLFGFSLGKTSDDSSYRSFRDYDSGYDHIAPLLFVAIDEDQSFPRYRALKDAIEEYVDRAAREDAIEDISIYFRNLNTSQWVAANAKERYAPASMLKVATLMAVLQAVEEEPGLMSRRVRVFSNDVLEKEVVYAPEEPLVSGNSYTVESLLTRLVRESDNLANAALVNLIGSERITRVYEELKLAPPAQGREEGYTADEYSRLYRTLYNSTFLSRPLSEYALALLGDTTFTSGIVSGVPAGVRVSHKFGVQTQATGAGNTRSPHELHDCGIVYYPHAPYFICVMTRGSNFSLLEKTIAEASRIVWEEVAKLQ